MSVVCCEVLEVSVTGPSLDQRRPTECVSAPAAPQLWGGLGPSWAAAPHKRWINISRRFGKCCIWYLH